MEDDVYAHHSTCTRERISRVFHGSRFGRDQAFSGDSSSEPGQIGFSFYGQLWRFRVLLSQRQPENSEAET
jgi:hypothetical protein